MSLPLNSTLEPLSPCLLAAVSWAIWPLGSARYSVVTLFRLGSWSMRAKLRVVRHRWPSLAMPGCGTVSLPALIAAFAAAKKAGRVAGPDLGERRELAVDVLAGHAAGLLQDRVRRARRGWDVACRRRVGRVPCPCLWTTLRRRRPSRSPKPKPRSAATGGGGAAGCRPGQRWSLIPRCASGWRRTRRRRPGAGGRQRRRASYLKACPLRGPGDERRLRG